MTPIEMPDMFQGKLIPCLHRPLTEWATYREVLPIHNTPAHPDFWLQHSARVEGGDAVYEVWRSRPHNGYLKGGDKAYQYYPARHLLIRLSRPLPGKTIQFAYCLLESVPDRKYKTIENFLIETANRLAQREAEALFPSERSEL